MDSIIVEGGNPLIGTVEISGAKNAALPLMAAALLTNEALVLTNMPTSLSDCKHMGEVLKHHGVTITNNTTKPTELTLSAKNITSFEAPYDLVRKLRASIWVLAPLVARFGEAKVSLPGGCVIGVRQIDLHLDVLKAMGTHVDLSQGYIHATAPKGLKATRFTFNKISVGATISAILAASVATGTSNFTNCAKEPEIVNLCECLNQMGAKISGIGTSSLTIEGVSSLKGTVSKVISDRIEAGTYMVAGAITKGKLQINNINPEYLESFTQKLIECGVGITTSKDSILVDAQHNELKASNVDTAPYPGIATDLQAQFMALMTVAKGTSIINETIFENRMMHVPELCRMGANIQVQHNTAIVQGVDQLIAAEVMASDLRASVSLILAGLRAEGQTKVSRVYHLDRGYERLEEKLTQCGANIRRISN